MNDAEAGVGQRTNSGTPAADGRAAAQPPTGHTSNLHTTPPAGWWSVLGWAAYLACSWTWCIGMFLPVLLVRDYGIWGFVVFAAPNVIGAAAMGWVLRSRESAERILREHAWAVRRFTSITIAFHFFFLGWILTIITPDNWMYQWPPSMIALCASGIMVAIASIVFLVSRGRLAFASALMWLASAALGILILRAGAWHDITDPHNASMFRSFRTGALLFLAPTCVFGFALCPYLDATFLHARHSLDRTSARAAFGLGFGVLFFAMILLTLGYSASLRLATSPSGAGGIVPAIAAALFPHLLLQAIFTIAVHIRAMPLAAKRHPIAIPLAVIFGLILTAIGILIGDYNYRSMLLGEVLYRVFMSFYGLVFPAYAWICMIPTGAGEHRHSGMSGPLGRVKVIVWLASVALATPAYWMGFIERQTIWLAPGLFIVLIARLIVVKRTHAMHARQSSLTR